MGKLFYLAAAGGCWFALTQGWLTPKELLAGAVAVAVLHVADLWKRVKALEAQTKRSAP